MSQINNIIKLIESNNDCTLTLPYSKEEITVKRYDIASLNSINDIFTKKNSSEVILDYYKYLIKIAKNRLNKNVSYLDYLFLLLYIRYNENEKYNDINLGEAIDNINENIATIKTPDNITIEDNKVKYTIDFELPDFEKLQSIIKICKNDTSDVLFYTIFKFIRSINIEVGDQTTTAESVQDLKSVYNVISYKALDKINSSVDDITSKLYNLYKVNIETDTGFFIST